MAASGFDAWASLWACGLRMADTGRKFAETAQAAGEVVESRVRTMAEAAADPFSGDYAELGRMVPEKIDAFGQAGTAIIGDLLAMQSAALANCQQMTSLAMAGRAPTLAEAEAMWSRSCGIMARAMDAGGKALAPVHKRATANAKRLRGRR